jgi:hypothetical protein
VPIASYFLDCGRSSRDPPNAGLVDTPPGMTRDAAMSEARAGWRAIPRSPARIAHERIERDGVAVLCARLAGQAENTPDGVARVKAALDDLGATLEPEVEVSTLDVTEFSNASDDACQILTGALAGLPCCWITHEWDQQRGGERWDLPASERMAATPEAALSRVVGWRRAGAYRVPVEGDECWTESRWGERGLVVRDVTDGSRTLEDLWYRNRLVERAIFDADPVRVLWPVADRTGLQHEALRRGARLVYSGELLIEADFNPYSTRRPLPADWVASVEGLVSLKILGLRGTAPLQADVFRAIAALPSLERLEVARGVLSKKAMRDLRRERPRLKVC